MTQPIHVLIVDDIRNNITALEASLVRPDLSVFKAESGPAALELLLKHEVALAILDVNMSGMDGFELAELMRGSTRTAHVPIIFLTATAQDASRTFRGYEAGAVDFSTSRSSRPSSIRRSMCSFTWSARSSNSRLCSNCSMRTKC